MDKALLFNLGPKSCRHNVEGERLSEERATYNEELAHRGNSRLQNKVVGFAAKYMEENSNACAGRIELVGRRDLLKKKFPPSLMQK